MNISKIPDHLNNSTLPPEETYKEKKMKEFDTAFPDFKKYRLDINDLYHGEVEKFISQTIDECEQRVKDKIDKSIEIHKKLADGIVGNNDFHIGAIKALGFLKSDDVIKKI